jgi:hypothetical protein
MKTIYSKRCSLPQDCKRSLKSNFSSLILSIAIFAFILGHGHELLSQTLESKAQLNVGIDASVSGTGLGAFYSGYVGVSKGRNIFNIGPCVQNRSMLVKGGRFCYAYLLTGYKQRNSLSDLLEAPDQSIQLRFFTYLQYVDKLPLSNMAVAREEKLNSNERDWTNLRFSTAEAGAGISLNIRVTKRIYWRNSLAIAGYYYTNYPGNMSHERGGVMLTLGTGFNIPEM